MMGRSTSVSFLLIAVVMTFVILTLAAWLMGADPYSLGNASGWANEAIRPWRAVLTFIRWGLWFVLWWRWAWVGNKLFRNPSDVATSQKVQWGAMRNRMMGGVALVEILILISAVKGA